MNAEDEGGGRRSTSLNRTRDRSSSRAGPAAPAGRFVMMDLTAHFNNDSISYRNKLSDGAFNVWGNSFPAEGLPVSGATVVVGRVPFIFPPKEDGAMNTVVSDGQVLETERALYDWIYFLGAGERRTEDWVYLHFARGVVDPEWIRISDFWPPGEPHFGETEAFRCPEMHYPHHVQLNLQPVIWRQRVPVTRARELEGIRLPINPAIHLFALTLVRTELL